MSLRDWFHPGRRWSARQRLVVLTFPSAEQAELWDRMGQPLGDDLVEYGIEVAVVHSAQSASPAAGGRKTVSD